MKGSNALVGVWQLLSVELRLQDGTTKYPWGKAVTGQVIYSSSGFMAGSFIKEDRFLFGVSDVMVGTPPAFEAAMRSYIGHAGLYSILGNRVIHHPEVSLFQNWTDIDVERFFEIQGDKLTLSTSTLIFDGIQGTAVLVWEKLSPYNNSISNEPINPQSLHRPQQNL
jgi:Lipocalin-like domain